MTDLRRMSHIGLTGVAIAALLLALDGIRPITAAAQQAAAPAPEATSRPATTDQLLRAEEIEALVAPIALYPDTLLSQILIASTYPLEVVQADRWLTENKKLKGDELKAAVDKQQWDDSVKALAATPDVLSMMSSKLDWTRKLGDTVLAQQADVMDAIQKLRSKAQANNKLVSTKEQKVTVQQQQGRDVIVIEPSDPNTVYVPYYDPAVVYGEWPYSDYPAYYFPPPPYLGGALLATGIAFGAGYALGRWVSRDYLWGGGLNWGNRNIISNRPVNINNIGNNWQHDPKHRQGVRYGNNNVQQRFGGGQRAGAQDRMDFRGHSGEQVLKPSAGDRGERAGGDRAGAGDRQGAGQRAGAGDRADRGGADRGGDRGGGERAKSDRAKTGAKTGAKTSPKTASTGGGAKGAGPKAERAKGAAGAGRPSTPSRPQREAALNVSSGRAASVASERGRASVGPRPMPSGGAMRAGGGMGGRAGGGFGGGRRSDAALKYDIRHLGDFAPEVGFYRFRYYGDPRIYVGVLAQEIEAVRPDAVSRGADGYLRVSYARLGVPFETYRKWQATGARIPLLSPH